MTTRYLNVLLGIWLVMSAFLWPHSTGQFWNAISVGLLVAALALIASETFPAARYFNTALGAWLIISAFTMHAARAGTIWNHFLVGLTVAVCSVFPNLPEIRRPRSGLPQPQ
jgi:hypothetical protein